MAAEPVPEKKNEAAYMRRTITFLILGHVLVAVFSFAFGSFITFAVQPIYIAMLYSIYMALHMWLVWVYIIVVGTNALSGILTLLGESGVGLIIYICTLLFYFIAVRTLFYHSDPYRNGSSGKDDRFQAASQLMFTNLTK